MIKLAHHSHTEEYIELISSWTGFGDGAETGKGNGAGLGEGKGIGDGEGIGYRGGYRFRCTDECLKGNYILGFGDGEGYGDGSGEGF